MLTFPVNILSPGAISIEFVGAGAIASTTGSTLVVAMPGGLLAGDIVVIVAGGSSGTSINITTVTTGYTHHIDGNNTLSGGEEAMDIWAKTAAGGEGSASVDFSEGINQKLGVALAYRNVNTVSSSAPAVDYAHGVTSITTNNWTDDVGVAVVAWLNNRDAIADTDITTPPADMTLRVAMDGGIHGGASRPDLLITVYDLVMANRGSINRTQTVNASDMAHIAGGIKLGTS